jgi:molecular chaperone IbpA
MTKITSFDLTPFYRSTVGIDSLFDRITRNIDMATNAGNYPPYDIIKTGDETYEIRLAVAGFTLDMINVEVRDGQLIVEGNSSVMSDTEKVPLPVEYLHHGISHRNFIRTFQLSDYVEVRDAVMRDGILTLHLERKIPEALKPKKIAISYQGSDQS